VVEYLNMSLLQIYQWVCQWKNFENRLTFGEVMGKSLVSCFFLRHSVVKNTYLTEGTRVLLKDLASVNYTVCIPVLWQVNFVLLKQLLMLLKFGLQSFIL